MQRTYFKFAGELVIQVLVRGVPEADKHRVFTEKMEKIAALFYGSIVRDGHGLQVTPQRREPVIPREILPIKRTPTPKQPCTSACTKANAHLLRAIDDALARITQDRFGVCEMCSAPISKARLEAVPWTRLCLDCKEREQSAA